MRLTELGPVVIASACFAATSAFAAPLGQHGRPPTHVESPAPPAAASHQVPPVTVPQRIAANPALVTRLQPLMPSGMTVASAAAGFKNQGQFITALHVSHNLHIPFAQLKTEMTGADHDSLGQAIHELQPNANVRTAVKTAERQAKADIKATKPAKTDADRDAERDDW